MNKKEIVTQKNIMQVADFLESACNHFKNGGEGLYHYQLDSDLEIAIGWSDGYDPNDNDIIKSITNENDKTCYAINAGVKVTNIWCSDFDYLDFPWGNDGEVWDNAITLRPDLTRRDYRLCAKWFLCNYVGIVNAHEKGECYFR